MRGGQSDGGLGAAARAVAQGTSLWENTWRCGGWRICKNGEVAMLAWKLKWYLSGDRSISELTWVFCALVFHGARGGLIRFRMGKRSARWLGAAARAAALGDSAWNNAVLCAILCRKTQCAVDWEPPRARRLRALLWENTWRCGGLRICENGEVAMLARK